MRELRTEIVIEAPRSVVWRLLTHLEGYADWNPFILRASGTPTPGSLLQIRMQPPGAKPMDYQLRTLVCEHEREFRWLGKMFFRGVLDGEHIFELTDAGPKAVRLIHREYFRGILVPFVWPIFLNTKLRRGFELMNDSLKETAEKLAARTATTESPP